MEVQIWPSGIARLADGILEVTTSDVRVALGDILEVGSKPPRLGHLSLTLKYRQGLETISMSRGVEQEHGDALRSLVETVEAAHR
jgi:hypothetical protein